MTTQPDHGEPPLDATVLRRHFVAVATGEYEDVNYHALPVAKEVAQLRAWLTDESRLGYRSFSDSPSLAQDPDEDSIREALKNPSRPWTERDAAVVFVTGHGQVVDDTHWLVLQGSESAFLPGTALRTADLIAWLRRPNGVRHLLLIVDACFAGAIAKDTVRLDDNLPQTWLILPSATKNSEATALALTTAIGRAVEKLRSGEGERFGVNRPYFRVSDFIDTVRMFLPGQDLDPIYRGGFNAEHVCLPNPHYRERDAVPTTTSRRDLAIPKRDLERHWAPRALGSGDSDGRIDEERRWLFTGRAELIRELIAIARGDRDNRGLVTLVTGGAGCGKSAVLARVVTLSDPAFVSAYSAEVDAIPPDLRPNLVHGVDVAIVAREKYAHEVLGQLGEALGADNTDGIRGEITLDRRIAALLTALQSRTKPATVVVDALDEAEEPLVIAESLARFAESGLLRLLVGVRSPGPSDDGLLLIDRKDGSLADDVERLFGARRLRIDEDPWWNQDDIRRYAESVLLHTPGSVYAAEGMHDQARGLAEAIAARIGRTFLVARLAATALTQRSEVVDPSDPAWLATLDEDVVGVFRADLQRLFPNSSARLSAVELLRAVAFAYGKGLPWGDIWPLVANAVADRHGKFGDSDIARLLASPMNAYLVTDTEDDVTVYRLFHDALRRTLRTRWRELLEEI